MKLSACHLLTNKIRVTKAASLCCSHWCKCHRTGSFIKDFSPNATFEHAWNSQNSLFYVSLPDVIPGDTTRMSNMTDIENLWNQRLKSLFLHPQHVPVVSFQAFPLAPWLAQRHSETKCTHLQLTSHMSRTPPVQGLKKSTAPKNKWFYYLTTSAISMLVILHKSIYEVSLYPPQNTEN